MVGFRREPGEYLAFLLDLPDCFRHVRVFRQGQHQRFSRLLLDLCVFPVRHAVIAYGCSLNDHVLSGSFLHHRVIEVLRRFNGNPADPLRYRNTDASVYGSHFRAPVPCGFADGKTHLSAGIVGDIPHRIHPFPGGTGCYQYLQPGKVLAAAEHAADPFGNGFRFAHPSGAFVAAGQHTAFRSDKPYAAFTQGPDVFLRCRRGPHPCVHRRCDEDRRFGRQHCRGKHVIRNPVCHLGDDVGCRGGNHKNIRQLGQRHMLHVPVFRSLECICYDRIGGKRLKSQRRNKFRRVFGHDYMNFRAKMTQTGDKFRAFIRGNASRYSQHDIPAGQIHISSAPPAQRGCHRSAVRG